MPTVAVSEEMAARLGPELTALAGEGEVVRLLPDGSASGDLDTVEVFCFSVDLATAPGSARTAFGLLASPALRWVQAPGAGVELPIWSDLVARGVVLTNAAGVHAEPVAQYVFTYILHWHRQVDRHARRQAARTWDPITSDDLTATTLGIVGYGGIGAALARIGAAFGMRVEALRRSRIDDPHVDTTHGPDGLLALLARADYTVLTLPLTAATEGLIDATALDAMPDHAVLVNVARGGVVDQAALVDALRRRSIRGAVLDVVDPEPLPTHSPLWALDNCVITPHDAGYSPLAGERLGRLFLDNLRRYVDGHPLRNTITPADLR